MWDVTCLGELFIDLMPHPKVEGKWLYSPSPGGAPGNVAVGLARLGHKALMLSRVGDDAFGRLIVNALQTYGVDVSGIAFSREEKTALSVVTLGEDGDRAFMFYHDHPADLHIDPKTVTHREIVQAKILHIGVLPLSAAQSGAAQRKAMDIADASRLPISCDVNFRPDLWSDRSAMLAAGRFIISRSAIVKVSEEELLALGGTGTLDEKVAALWHDKLELFSVSLGAQGAVLYSREGKHTCAAFAVNAIDTTGAGDAYTAAVLSGYLKDGLEQSLEELVKSACAAGALATTKKGAMESLPNSTDIKQLLNQQKPTVSFLPRI